MTQTQPADWPHRAETVFGQRVRALRKARGWSQEDLRNRMAAAGFDMHQVSIGRLENAQRPTSVAEVAALAEIFGIDPGEFFTSRGPDEAIALGDLNTAIERVEQMSDGLMSQAAAMTFMQQHLRVALWVAREVVGIDDPVVIKRAEQLLREKPEARAKATRQAVEDEMWSDGSLEMVRRELAVGKPWEARLNEHLEAERAHRRGGGFTVEVERAMRAQRPKKGSG